MGLLPLCHSSFHSPLGSYFSTEFQLKFPLTWNNNSDKLTVIYTQTHTWGQFEYRPADVLKLHLIPIYSWQPHFLCSYITRTLLRKVSRAHWLIMHVKWMGEKIKPHRIFMQTSFLNEAFASRRPHRLTDSLNAWKERAAARVNQCLYVCSVCFPVCVHTWFFETSAKPLSLSVIYLILPLTHSAKASCS